MVYSVTVSHVRELLLTARLQVDAGQDTLAAGLRPAGRR